MNSTEYALLPRVAELCEMIHSKSKRGYIGFDLSFNFDSTFEICIARFNDKNYTLTNNHLFTSLPNYRYASLEEALEVLELIAHHGIRKPHEYADYLSSLKESAA